MRCCLVTLRASIVLFSLLAGVNVRADGETQLSQQQKFEVNIPALNAAAALNMLAEQTDSSLLFSYKEAKATRANAVTGRYTLGEALRVLLQGSGLRGSLSENGAIKISSVKNDRRNQKSEQRGVRRMKTQRGLIATVIGLIIGAGGLQQSAAQGSAAAGGTGARRSTLEEIVVTAQKRTQNLQDVGIAITAFTGKELAQLGYENSPDIARMTPGMYVASNTGGIKQLYIIRGVGQNDYNDQTESPVAVYMDGSYIALLDFQNFSLFDIDRVEVLKGPQGTLFGRNATGGVVRYITRKPTRKPEGYAQVTYGSYNQTRFEGAIGGPLGQTVAGRLAVMYNRHDDIFRNTYPQNAITLNGLPAPGGRNDWNDNTVAVRGELSFDPNEDIHVLITGNYGRTDAATPPEFGRAAVPVLNAAGEQISTVRSSLTETREEIGPGGIGLNAPFSFDANSTRPTPGGSFFGPTCSEKDFKELRCSIDFAFNHMVKNETYGATGTFTWKFPAFTLTSISAYRHFFLFHRLDADAGSTTTLSTAELLPKAYTFTQEVRLNGEFSRARWLAGFYYLRVRSKPGFALNASANSLWAPLFGGPASDVVSSDMETDSWSLFGQGEYDLTKSLRLIAGVRGIIERHRFTMSEAVFASTDERKIEMDTLLVQFQPRRHFRQKENMWSGKVQLDWHPVEHWLLYAGVSRGVKAGGFNSPATFGAPLDTSLIAYPPEELVSYEAGFKGEFLNRTMRLNGAFYYYDYKNYQAYVFQTAAGLIFPAHAHYKGAELEFESTPLEGLDIVLNGSYIDAKVDKMEIAPGIYRSNTKPTFTPKYQVAGLVRYEWPETLLNGTVSVQTSFNYVSSVFADARNFPAQKLDQHVLGNARLEWESGDRKWDAAFFVKNIADARYMTDSVDVANLFGTVNDVPGLPRWFGASVRYNFF